MDVAALSSSSGDRKISILDLAYMTGFPEATIREAFQEVNIHRDYFSEKELRSVIAKIVKKTCLF